MNISKASALIAFAAGASAMASVAEARFGYRDGYQDGMTVVAESQHGNGRQAGVVRAARYGWEVRLPRGTWVACRRSCEETLRVETVDLYERQDGTAGFGDAQNECGIFGCLSIGR